MTFSPPPAPAHGYGPRPEPAAEPDGFATAMSAAIAATEAVEDVVVEHPTAPASTATATAQPTTPDPTPADPATVEELGDGRWKVSAATLETAVAAATALGDVEVGGARTVSRGLGPWKRTTVELTAERRTPVPSSAPEPVEPAVAQDPADAEPAGDEPAAPSPAAPASGPAAHVLSMLAAVADDDEEEVARPVLPPPLPDCAGIDFPTALTGLRLSERVIADAAGLDPADAGEWVRALSAAVEDALSRAGTLDAEYGGYYVNGVGVAGAIALVNAASSGKSIGTLQWRGVTAPPTAQRVVAAILSALA